MSSGPGPGMASPGLQQGMHGFTTDESATKQRLRRGIVRRIAGYARPYRWDLVIFLVAAAMARETGPRAGKGTKKRAAPTTAPTRQSLGY